MNWKRLFEPHILKRGNYYYLDNAVDDLKISSDEITAKVHGTADYEVEIHLNGATITGMYCPCPYADGGKNCKHMAAVLYAWSEQKQNRPDRKTDDVIELFRPREVGDEAAEKTVAVKGLVDEADISTVRSYLTNALLDDNKLLLKFYDLVCKDAPNHDAERYIDQVDIITEKYLEEDGFIDYYRAGAFVSEIEETLNMGARRLIDRGSYMAAFKLVNYTYDLIENVEMDDSDGGRAEIWHSVYELWLQLLKKVNQAEKREMFRRFTEQADEGKDHMGYIVQILTKEFSEKEYEQPRLAFFKKKLDEAAKGKDKFSYEYDLDRWAERYLELLERDEAKKTEIEQFYKDYWDSRFVRNSYIGKCIDNRKYDEALRALDDSMVRDRAYRGIMAAHSETKKKIYRLQGNTEAYNRELRSLFVDYKPGDMDIFRELKAQYTPEEWKVEREKLFRALPQHADIAALYEEERLYDRLIDHVMQSNGMYALSLYRGVLEKDYPAQLLAKYKAELNKQASYAGDRKSYRELVKTLQSMKTIKGGTEAVNEIAAEWRQKYKNRPAMMDELKSL